MDVFFEQIDEGYCRTHVVASDMAREAVLIDPVLERQR
jgi:hypothetical protein